MFACGASKSQMMTGVPRSAGFSLEGWWNQRLERLLARPGNRIRTLAALKSKKVGLVRGGAGTALVGSPQQVADRIKEYAALGLEYFVLSGYPHLEEAIRFAELVFPLLPGKQPVTLRDQAMTGGAFDVRATDKTELRKVA